MHDVGMFTLDFPTEPRAPKASEVAKPAEFNLGDINLNLDADKSTDKSAVDSAQRHEVATKLDLAKAYQEMGDASGAKEILEEVLNEGDAEQRAAAQEILRQLG
jgi:pilus assembly protein FimV